MNLTPSFVRDSHAISRPTRAAITRFSYQHLLVQAGLQVWSTSARLAQSLHQQVRLRQKQHPFGYCYVPLVGNRLVELLILRWPDGSDSKPHSHLASINVTRVLSGRVLERKYHVTGGQLRVISERVLGTGQWAWTLPFEIHELVTLDDSAETLHLYFPGRLC